MYTQAFKDAQIQAINDLPLLAGIHEFEPEYFDVSKVADKTYLRAYAKRLQLAEAEHEKANKLPSVEDMRKTLALKLLAEIFADTDVAEFPSAFNALKDLTIKELDFLHFSVGEFGELVTKSLKQGNAFTAKQVQRICNFQAEVVGNEVNFLAACKKHKITKSFATILVDNSKVQNDRLGQSKEEREASTLTLKEALQLISKGETPYAPVVNKVEPKGEKQPVKPIAPKPKK